MLIRFGPTAAVDARDAARVRGAVAGLISGAVSVAAHGWAAPMVTPDATAIMLLAAVSAVLGASVAEVRPLRTGPAALVAALAGGQVLGHLGLGWGSGHLHHGDLQLTPTMLTAHLLTALAAAALVVGAETAYRIGAAALSRTLPLLFRPTTIDRPAPLPNPHRDRVILRIFTADTDRPRAPPHPS